MINRGVLQKISQYVSCCVVLESLLYNGMNGDRADQISRSSHGKNSSNPILTVEFAVWPDNNDVPCD